MKTRSEKNMDRLQKWCRENPEKHSAAKLRWQRLNPEKRAASQRRYQQANKEKGTVKTRRWRQANPEKVTAAKRRRYASDPSFRLLINCRRRVYRALRGKLKSAKTLELIGCTVAQLRLWLVQQFSPGMTFENYGKWHVDHIRPCASFDLNDPTQQKECFHYTNLQPLWAADHFRKSAKEKFDSNRNIN